MSSSSSSSCSDSSDEEQSRLGPCEVCGANDAKYTCPKCEVKTCRLKCVIIHKKELECDGIRDRTKFIRMQDFKDRDLLSDYRLLEECARFVDSRKRDINKRYTRIDKELPIHLYKMKMAARKRGTALQFLAQNFTRHAVNTTRYDWKKDLISWRIEWFFPNADPESVKFVDERCEESTRLSELLDKYLNPETVKFEGSNSLMYYRAAGFNGVKILLKAEKVRSSSRKYYELDSSLSLRENLAGKCIVEFPLICVVLKDHCCNFDIVDSDDETESKEKNETIQENKDLNHNEDQPPKVPETLFQRVNEHSMPPANGHRRPFKRVPRQLLTQKYNNEKKAELKKEMEEERKKKPRNLLFTTGYSSEEGLSDDSADSGTETPGLSSVKRLFVPPLLRS